MSTSGARAAALAVAVVAAVALAPTAIATAQRGDPTATGRSAAAPSVQAMVVGRGGSIVSPARTIVAAATSLRIDNRSCAVAAATPLAVLADLRAQGGPGFAVRDYGHCGASPADSAQLFVYALAGERNSGQNGWEYKVGGAAGSTGAGDPSGPRGNGVRVRGGERVLWFWCQARAGGCQRTLEVSGPGAVSRARALTATVYAYDNEGRGAPVAGAVVALAGARARTGAHGHATLSAPSAPGRYRLTATRGGMVPSFPVTVLVR